MKPSASREQAVSAEESKAPGPVHRGLIVPLIVGCAILMQTLDATLVATALPAISRSLHLSPLIVDVVLTAYFAGAAMFLPASGWMADRLGARNVFVLSIVVFAAGSLIAGSASGIVQLVAGRAVQGMAGSMLMPVGRLLLLRSVPRSQMIAAMSVVTVPALLGPALGPIIGGLAVSVSSWRSVFLINIPIAILGLALVYRFIPNIKSEKVANFDWIGLLLLGAGLVGCAFGLGNLGRQQIAAEVTLALIAGGVLSLALYTFHERRRGAVLIDLSLFQQRTFASAMWGGFFMRLIISATPYLLVMLLQIGFGKSALAAGLLISATAVGSLTMRTTAFRIIRRFGFRNVMVANGFMTALTLAVCAAFTSTTDDIVIFLVLAVHGFFRALQLTCINTLPYSELAHENMSSATTVVGISQQLSQSLGIGVCASLIAVLHGAWGGGTLTPAQVSPAFVVLALLSLISIPFFLRLAPNAGEETAGRAPAAN